MFKYRYTCIYIKEKKDLLTSCFIVTRFFLNKSKDTLNYSIYIVLRIIRFDNTFRYIYRMLIYKNYVKNCYLLWFIEFLFGLTSAYSASLFTNEACSKQIIYRGTIKLNQCKAGHWCVAIIYIRIIMVSNYHNHYNPIWGFEFSFVKL